MPNFGKTSRSRLAECHEDIQKVCNKVIKFFDFTITCGRRGQVEQDKAYLEGRSKARYGQSPHNSEPLSDAVDAAPWPVIWPENCKTQKDKVTAVARFFYLAGRMDQAADEMHEKGEIEKPLRWGGDWDSDDDFFDNTFNDFPHFERQEWNKK